MNKPSRALRRVFATAAAGLLLTIPATVSAVDEAPPRPTGQSASHPDVCPGDYAAATHNDAEFNRLFQHRFARVDGMRLHYVVGGSGPVMVLLHGWPQTWYEFRPVMPALAKNHTLIVVDLPGLGDSRGKPSSYDKKTLARTLHRLIADRLGHRRIDLVGHDFGAGVAFQYAAQHPAEVKHLVHMDYPLPGPSTPAQGPTSLTWHFGFNAADDHLAERLVRGQERIYMQHIYNLFGGRPNPVPPRAVKEYVRTYSQPAKLSAGFELYRTLPLDQKHNNALVDDKPLTMPVLVLGASIYGDDSVDVLTADIRPFAHNVTGRFVPDSGHWMSEEKPRFVIKAITRFVN